MEATKPEVNIKDTSKKPGEKFSVYTFNDVELPQATEKSYEDFVTYGANNNFPNIMIDAWLQSSIHNALTNGIVQMITGDEITFSNKIVDVETWAKRVNRKGESLAELIHKTAFDLYLHGYFGWNIVWNQARNKIVSVYHVPAEQIRSGKADEDGVINEYFTSWDWSQYRKKKFEPQRIKAFDPSDRSEGKQMLFVKQYRPNQFYYSTPSYIGGMNWILMDNRVGEFHLNNIENGFFPSSVVQFFNGEPPQEEKRKIEMGFMDKFTGKGQSKIVFVYNNNQDEKVSFDTYEGANIDKRFRDLMPEISKNIMIAHRVPSPLLFGIRDSGGLGNNAEELESSSLLMNKMVIVPFQQMILEQLAMIFRINKWATEITIETLQPSQWLEGKSNDADGSTADDPKETSTGTPDAGTDTAEPVEDVAKLALNGAQISSLMLIVENIVGGILSKPSAKSIIAASFPSFTPEQINQVVDPLIVNPNPESFDKFSGRQGSNVIQSEFIKPIVNHLKKKGESREELENDGWVCIEDAGNITAEGVKLRLSPDEFANISSNPEGPSTLDKGLYKIRYEYRGPRDEKNRDFCASVLDLNLIYRKEDINTMTNNVANPEFGSYSIWDYKGSYGCRHRWHRLVFFRKRNPRGQFLPNEGLENDKTVGPGATPAEVVSGLGDENATTENVNI